MTRIEYPPKAFDELSRKQLLTLAIALEDQRDRALAILARIRPQLETVRGLHMPDPTVPLCIECRKYYPCQTARAAVAGGVVVEEGML